LQTSASVKNNLLARANVLLALLFIRHLVIVGSSPVLLIILRVD